MPPKSERDCGLIKNYAQNRKKLQKTIDKQKKKVYNTIENKAGLSALTYLQKRSRVNKRLDATILSGFVPCGDLCLCTVIFFRLEVFNN